MQGRVEIYHDGQWGTICRTFFNDMAASVVCRMLGYMYVFCQSLSLPPYIMCNKELRVQANGYVLTTHYFHFS